MSLSQDELMALMAYVDGELDGEELSKVEALVARNKDAERLVAELGATGDWVRESCRAKAIAAGADNIADRVMADAEALDGGEVIALEKARARRTLNRKRMKEFGGLLAVAAVFAMIWMWPDSSKKQTPDTVAAKGPNLVVPIPRPPEDMPAPIAADSAQGVAVAVGGEEGVDLENVESPHQVSVFYLPVTNKNAASLVVWIGEEEVH